MRKPLFRLSDFLIYLTFRFARETLSFMPDRSMAQNQGFISFFRTLIFDIKVWNPEQKLIIFIKHPPKYYLGEQDTF